MIIEFSVVDTKDFTIEHLFDNPENLDLIANFQATNGAAGLEYYLKNQSVDDEENNCSRTYLVKDALSAELVAYFSLKTGLITIQLDGEKFDSVPAIELANFAINKKYKYTSRITEAGFLYIQEIRASHCSKNVRVYWCERVVYLRIARRKIDRSLPDHGIRTPSGASRKICPTPCKARV